MHAVLIALLVLWLGAVSPGVAGACACGAVLADSRLEAVQETALVELDGSTESVTVNIATDDSEASEAAFLMPVPARAEFTLADGELFADLDDVSAPRIEYREVERDDDGDGAGAGAPPGESEVTVTDHVEVGPYEVAQLTGTDSGAVAEWLDGQGFTLPTNLAGQLDPYLADGWLVVAVHLTPKADGDTFAGGLPPMTLTFATDEPVYPMRLSAAAEYSQPLRLYVLADHRMDISNPAPAGEDPELTFAGWVRPGDLSEHPALAELVSEQRFLTRYDAEFRPEQITGDILLTRADTDDSYRATVVETRYVSRSNTIVAELTESVPAWAIWLLSIVAGLAVVTLAVVVARRVSRSR